MTSAPGPSGWSRSDGGSLVQGRNSIFIDRNYGIAAQFSINLLGTILCLNICPIIPYISLYQCRGRTLKRKLESLLDLAILWDLGIPSSMSGSIRPLGIIRSQCAALARNISTTLTQKPTAVNSWNSLGKPKYTNTSCRFENTTTTC